MCADKAHFNHCCLKQAAKRERSIFLLDPPPKKKPVWLAGRRTAVSFTRQTNVSPSKMGWRQKQPPRQAEYDDHPDWRTEERIKKKKNLLTIFIGTASRRHQGACFLVMRIFGRKRPETILGCHVSEPLVVMKARLCDDTPTSDSRQFVSCQCNLREFSLGHEIRKYRSPFQGTTRA